MFLNQLVFVLSRVFDRIPVAVLGWIEYRMPLRLLQRCHSPVLVLVRWFVGQDGVGEQAFYRLS